MNHRHNLFMTGVQDYYSRSYSAHKQQQVMDDTLVKGREASPFYEIIMIKYYGL